jgi:hypothetical protein
VIFDVIKVFIFSPSKQLGNMPPSVISKQQKVLPENKALQCINSSTVPRQTLKRGEEIFPVICEAAENFRSEENKFRHVNKPYYTHTLTHILPFKRFRIITVSKLDHVT